MRESLTLLQNGLQSRALQGGNEAHSDAYMTYEERALELPTQQSREIHSDLRACLVSKVWRCKLL